MGRSIWKAQASVFMFACRFIPTSFLQMALSKREGVKSIPVRHDESRAVTARGPCVVTINHV